MVASVSPFLTVYRPPAAAISSGEKTAGGSGVGVRVGEGVGLGGARVGVDEGVGLGAAVGSAASADGCTVQSRAPPLLVPLSVRGTASPVVTSTSAIWISSG